MRDYTECFDGHVAGAGHAPSRPTYVWDTPSQHRERRGRYQTTLMTIHATLAFYLSLSFSSDATPSNQQPQWQSIYTGKRAAPSSQVLSQVLSKLTVALPQCFNMSILQKGWIHETIHILET